MESKSIKKDWFEGFIWHDLFSRSKKDIDPKQTLKNTRLFSKLSNSELRYIERIVHRRKYSSGEPIFLQNERAVGMYIIAKGSVAIRAMRSVESDLVNPEKETAITILKQGSFFGEQALVEEEARRTASAYAQEPTELIAFLKPDLMEIIQRRPTLGVKIVLQLSKVMSTRLKTTTQKLSEYAIEYRKMKRSSEENDSR